MGHRYRWWYRMTGVPGWMRFGFSPGWLGYGNYGPGAQYLLSGNWPTPQMNYLWQTGQIPQVNEPMNPGFGTPYDPYGAGQISPEQELEILKGQADEHQQELENIRKKITELEKG